MAKAKTHMDISVVIPVFNAERTIAACLESLYAQDVSPLEIIVVDNGSTDKTMEVVSHLVQRHNEVTTDCLREARRGPSFARNRGASQARGDVIAFLDADCIADSSWLDRVSRSFDRSEIGAVAGSIIGFDKETTIGKFHALFTMRALPSSRLFHEFDLLSGGFPTANLSIRTTLFSSLGGFDETMPIYAEDHDLCARIYQSRVQIFFNKEAIVYHQHRQSLQTTWRQSYGFGTGHAILLKKHFQRMLIIEMPRWRYLSRRWPLRAWVDIAAADKKFILCLLLTGLWPPFLAVLALYLMLLYRNIGQRLAQDQIEANCGEKWALVFLLLFKSLAITCGRWRGSLAQGVLCL
ncbi:MAG: glycosyltransferase [Desulfobacterales bacterium]|nr:glycosyltransferase [Desulfobacterales bacterium]